MDANHCEVGERVGTDHLGAKLAAVGEGGSYAVPALDHVGRGQHVAVGGDRDAAAGALAAAAAGAVGHREVGNRGPEAISDPGDRARVGVEGVRVGKPLGWRGGLRRPLAIRGQIQPTGDKS